MPITHNGPDQYIHVYTIGNLSGKVWCNLALYFHQLSTMPRPLTQPGNLSHSLPNDNLISYSSVYSFDSSFGIDSIQGLESPRFSQPSQLQPANEAINQQSNGVDLGGEEEELSRESSHPCGTPDRSKNQSLYEIPSTTPVIRRIASYRHFLPSAAPKRERILAREMGDYLAIELDNVKPTNIIDLPNIIFPDSSLPFPVNEGLLRQLKDVWNPRKKVLIPPIAYTEAGIQNWFNLIAHNIASVKPKSPASRYWSSQYCNTVLPDKELEYKPDVILIDNQHIPLDWRSVHAVAEVTSRKSFHSEMKRTINNKTYLMFSTQHNRRFVPFLAICAHKIYFFVTDREGQAMSEIRHLQEGDYHALNLIRIIVALMFAQHETIGFDPTMTTSHEGQISTISANGEKYTVKSAIHIVQGIIGRSTRVWSVHDSNKRLCIVKDGWIQEGRADAERQYLEKLNRDEVAGIPQLLWGGTVQIHDPKDPLRQRFCDDHTAWIRHGFSDGTKYRIHRRLILSPVGQDLSSFTSLGELVTALRDVAVGGFISHYSFQYAHTFC